MSNTDKPLSLANFGTNLYHARHAAGMTILDLAVEIGVSERMISYYEEGKKIPTLPKFILICEVLGVDQNDILR